MHDRTGPRHTTPRTHPERTRPSRQAPATKVVARLPYDPVTGKRTPYEPTFRTVRTEVQRRTAGGGWTCIAVAENPDWADTLCRAMNWIMDDGGEDPESRFG